MVHGQELLTERTDTLESFDLSSLTGASSIAPALDALSALEDDDGNVFQLESVI